MMNGLLHNIKRRAAAVMREEGLAYIEFALSIGVLLILFFGAIEISRYILIVQKVEKTVDTLTDVLTQALPGSISNSTITQYLSTSQQLMNPYSFGANGNVILTDLSTPLNSNSPITMQWQVCGGGVLHAVSLLGSSPGSTVAAATLSSVLGGFTMNAGEEVVVGEIFFNFSPILLQNVVSPAQVYRTAVFKPRYGYQSLDNPNTVTSAACP
jgi:Flp pilus assembly protein TadG